MSTSDSAASKRDEETTDTTRDSGDTSSSTGAIPDDAPETVIRPTSGWLYVDWGELIRYRELLWLLSLHHIRVRYKQTVLGILWAVIQPLVTMAVFGLLFAMLLGRNRMPTVPGVPYVVCTFAALVPWQLFAGSLTRSGESVVSNQHIITKVYFPRLYLPVAQILAGLLDFTLSFIVLIGMMLLYGITPGWGLLVLPLAVVLIVVTAASVSLWLAALDALYRDVQHAIPFIAQIWMYVTPVVYTTEALLGGRPRWMHLVYGLNPMVGVIETFRWALIPGASPPSLVMIPSFCIVALLLVGGMFYFRRMERIFADVV
jgi:homopolymeric O-antigen transport system permease protein